MRNPVTSVPRLGGLVLAIALIGLASRLLARPLRAKPSCPPHL
jgi:hypothetical protein